MKHNRHTEDTQIDFLSRILKNIFVIEDLTHLTHIFFYSKVQI